MIAMAGEGSIEYQDLQQILDDFVKKGRIRRKSKCKCIDDGDDSDDGDIAYLG